MHRGKCASGDMSGYHESRQQQLRLSEEKVSELELATKGFGEVKQIQVDKNNADGGIMEFSVLTHRKQGENYTEIRKASQSSHLRGPLNNCKV